LAWIFAIESRIACIWRNRLSTVGWTSWIETCWSRISPRAENLTIASWTLPIGTRSVMYALPRSVPEP
jgi:hypothetical protein